MIICQLVKQGVGSTVIAETGTAGSTTRGMLVFADDTWILAESAERLQMETDLVIGTFRALGLTVAGAKSIHIPLMFDKLPLAPHGATLLMEEELAEGRGKQVIIEGERVPYVEADVGTRCLGYHVDLHDGGERIAILRRKIDEFGAAIRHKRMSKRVAAYLWHTVLIPRIMFPLSVLRINRIDIENLESRALRYILPKSGMNGTAARHLIGA